MQSVQYICSLHVYLILHITRYVYYKVMRMVFDVCDETLF